MTVLFSVEELVMNPIDARFPMCWPTWWRPTRAVILVIGMLLGYAALVVSSTPVVGADDVSRVELLE